MCLAACAAAFMLWGCSAGGAPARDVQDATVDEVSTDDLTEDVASSELPKVDSVDTNVLPEPTTCDPRLLAPGQVRAKPVVCVEELPRGPKAIGRVGDFLLENNLVRFVIRAGHGHTFVGMDGGTVVDADLARTPGSDGEDRLQEIIPLFSFNSVSLETVEITSFGDGGEAVVIAQGPATAVPYLASLLPILPVAPQWLSSQTTSVGRRRRNLPFFRCWWRVWSVV